MVYRGNDLQWKVTPATLQMLKVFIAIVGNSNWQFFSSGNHSDPYFSWVGSPLYNSFQFYRFATVSVYPKTTLNQLEHKYLKILNLILNFKF